ncbi:putative DNA topoisomerase [Helianthus anomalus]
MSRALHSLSGTRLCCSSGGKHTCERLFEVDFKRVTVSCIFNGGRAKASNFKPLNPYFHLGSHINRSYSAFPIQPLFRSSSRDNMLPLNSISYSLTNGGFGTFAPYKGVLSMRLFSTPRAILPKIAVGDGEKRAKSTSFLAFNKHWTQSKKLKKRVGNEGKPNVKSSLKALENDEIVTLKDPPVEDVKKELSEGQSANGKLKPKRQPKTKKGPEKSTVVSEEPTPQASSRSASRSKKSKSSKSDLETAASEVSANGKPAVEVNLEEEQSKGAAKKKTGKRKPKTQLKSSLTSNDAVQISHVTESPFNSKINTSVTHVTESPSSSKTSTSVKNKTLKPLYPPTGKSVVVVESMTKAKVIQGYLGDMYEVLPSYGHVRDLAARSGSVRPDDDFSMVWEVPSAAWTHLKSIKVALTGTENLILASDPDREGEAIAWHIIEMLQQQNALPESINVARVVFNEITESSIKQALQAPRDIDFNLVHAYLARRALDYLIGFNISPLLWRKLPGCQSAGRVQSVALALICDRETEIDKFEPQEYWTIEGDFNYGKGSRNFSCPSHLTHYDSKKLNQMSITSCSEASDIENMINASEFEVVGSSKKNYKKTSSPPYITSTLQQDSASKLHFPSSYTMKLAQKLYEGVKLPDGKSAGLITYMRTDGLHMSDEAVEQIRSFVKERYGQNYIPNNARKFFKKVKNAQEAHEAIRPTDIKRLPSTLSGILDEDSLKLYTLIWARAVSCQMEPSVTEQIQVDIGNANRSIIFRATSSRKDFLGFQAVYKDVETKIIKNDEDQEDERNTSFDALNGLKAGDQMSLGKLELKEHHTQHPPRYSEGSLVKKMEELGIGRPSTYATTIKVLKDRNYVTLKNRVLYPEFRGRMVSAFLFHHFSEVTDYSFTADMETELDNVSGGMTEWRGLLRDYWTRFSKYCERASSVHIHQVEKMLEKTFGEFLFASLPDQSRTCPSCKEGTLIFKVSRFGAGYFIGCDQHPHCKYIAKTLYGEDDNDDSSPENGRAVEEPKLLGLHPDSGEKILLKDGPYGHYVQLGEDKKGHLPKRASVSQIPDISSITVEMALQLLRYPITLGKHPDDGQPVVLKLARHGLSVKHRRTQAPVPKNTNPDEITLEKAMKFLTGKDAKQTGRPKKNKEKQAVEVL